jgi:hypothetical protein
MLYHNLERSQAVRKTVDKVFCNFDLYIEDEGILYVGSSLDLKSYES